MLAIRARQLAVLDDSTWRNWVSRHVEALEEMLPEVAAPYPPGEFANRVEALLRRADLHGMVQECETLAYCYGSLTLGLGFESRPEFEWVAAAMAASGPTRAGLLWEGFEAEVENQPDFPEILA